MASDTSETTGNERACAYRVLRYAPNLVRDEWVNIGVLVFDPASGERRWRLIEEPEEYARVHRPHPRADGLLLRALRNTWRTASPPPACCSERRGAPGRKRARGLPHSRSCFSAEGFYLLLTT